MAGVKPETRQLVSDETYFHRLTKATEALGRYPKASERKEYRLNMSKRRYPTLTSFIEKAIELGYVEDLREGKLQRISKSKDAESPSEIVKLIKNALHKSGQQERPVPPIPLNTKRTKWERAGIS